MQNLKNILHIVEESAVDLVVYAGGDLCRFITPERNYFDEIAKKTACKLFLGVAGDEDSKSLHEYYHSEHVRDLHQQPFLFDNILFLGQEGAVAENGNLRYTESEIENHLNEQYSKSNNAEKVILVSHSPPVGRLAPGKESYYQCTGSTSIEKFHQANLIICGHCHKWGGDFTNDSERIVLNIASDMDGNADGKYAIIDINNSGIQEPRIDSIQSFYISHPLGPLVNGSPKNVLHFIDAGIKSLADISETNREKLEQIPGSNKSIAEKWILYATAFRENNIQLTPEFKEKINAISQPLIYDIETSLGGNPVFLIGVYDIRNEKFVQFCEKRSEKSVIEKFENFLKKNQNATLISFSGSQYDKLWLLKAFDRHDLSEETGLIEKEIDLGSELKKKIKEKKSFAVLMEN